jgi:hypothetical protein
MPARAGHPLLRISRIWVAMIGIFHRMRASCAQLLEMVRMDAIDPSAVLTEVEPLMSAIDAYKAFYQRQPGWIKVELLPPVAMRGATEMLATAEDLAGDMDITSDIAQTNDQVTGSAP